VPKRFKISGATEIAKALGMGRASVYRVLDAGH
jgi:predicted DNA-binding transcriptional regulator AlpA